MAIPTIYQLNNAIIEFDRLNDVVGGRHSSWLCPATYVNRIVMAPNTVSWSICSPILDENNSRRNLRSYLHMTTNANYLDPNQDVPPHPIFICDVRL